MIRSLEIEWEEIVARPLIELGLELHPVESEGVQERRQALHQYWRNIVCICYCYLFVFGFGLLERRQTQNQTGGISA